MCSEMSDAKKNMRQNPQAMYADFEYKPLCIIQNGVCYLKQNRLKDYRHSSSCRLRKGDENLLTLSRMTQWTSPNGNE